jgi:hypothetical protein
MVQVAAEHGASSKEILMRPISRTRGAAVLFALAVSSGTFAQTTLPQVPERLASFEMAWLVQKPKAIGARATAVAEALTGQDLRRSAPVVPLKSAVGDRRLSVVVPEAPAIEIVYLPDYDELRIIDVELAMSTAPEGEMQQEEALRIAKSFFDELVRRQIVDARHYDWSNPDIASTWVGLGSRKSDSLARKRVEYRITLRRIINGIELANAGVRIAVHTSGRISGVRFGGVTVSSKPSGEVEEPVGKGKWLRAQVPLEHLQARFERELIPANARPSIAWSRIMYVMPENKRSAVVAPLYVVSYSLQVPSEDGETMVSRRKTVGFSLVDKGAAPVDLTPPVRAPQIEKRRKQ